MDGSLPARPLAARQARKAHLAPNGRAALYVLYIQRYLEARRVVRARVGARVLQAASCTGGHLPR